MAAAGWTLGAHPALGVGMPAGLRPATAAPLGSMQVVSARGLPTSAAPAAAAPAGYPARSAATLTSLRPAGALPAAAPPPPVGLARIRGSQSATRSQSPSPQIPAPSQQQQHQQSQAMQQQAYGHGEGDANVGSTNRRLAGRGLSDRSPGRHLGTTPSPSRPQMQLSQSTSVPQFSSVAGGSAQSQAAHQQPQQQHQQQPPQSQSLQDRGPMSSRNAAPSTARGGSGSPTGLLTARRGGSCHLPSACGGGTSAGGVAGACGAGCGAAGAMPGSARAGSPVTAGSRGPMRTACGGGSCQLPSRTPSGTVPSAAGPARGLSPHAGQQGACGSVRGRSGALVSGGSKTQLHPTGSTTYHHGPAAPGHRSRAGSGGTGHRVGSMPGHCDAPPHTWRGNAGGTSSSSSSLCSLQPQTQSQLGGPAGAPGAHGLPPPTGDQPNMWPGMLQAAQATTPRMLPMMTPRGLREFPGFGGAAPGGTATPVDLNASSRTLPPSRNFSSPQATTPETTAQAPNWWPPATGEQASDDETITSDEPTIIHSSPGFRPAVPAGTAAMVHTVSGGSAVTCASVSSTATATSAAAAAAAATAAAAAAAAAGGPPGAAASGRSPRLPAHLVGASRDKLINVILQLESDVHSLQRRVEENEAEREKDRNALRKMAASMESLKQGAGLMAFQHEETGATGETGGAMRWS
eukprot:TRINITY_DN8435_c0_g2_i1.p1 TRINITY_DN8435_c0_g2~~TRINITY_DN8435_c0_g2_i1.p1  ORF type:complete len:720 (-),score=112.27 TRINITY_DN8435_c0_g2_i1:88-2154(-)